MTDADRGSQKKRRSWGGSIYVLDPGERSLARLDALARERGESVARAAGRLVAGVLSRPFEPRSLGKLPERGYRPPLWVVPWESRRGERVATGTRRMQVCVPSSVMPALKRAARANGMPLASIAGMLLAGALGVPWRQAVRTRRRVYTEEEMRLRRRACSARRYYRLRDEINRKAAERRRTETPAQRAARLAAKREWERRYREKLRAERAAAAAKGCARPAGW